MTKQKNSKFFSVISFLSLTDSEVLASCGRYDRMLAYAMVFRQLVTFAFTFMLFAYGVSLFLGTTAAIITGFVFALTLFFLDQAIIGSDWAMRSPFKSGLPIRTLLGLIPRVFYSLIIAVGLATLAEISLQSSAIDEQIQKESNQNNKEYFSKMEAYEKELDTAIAVDSQRVEDLQSQMVLVRNQLNTYKTAEQNNDTETVQNTLDVQQISLSELQKSQQVLISEIATLNEQISSARKQYNYFFNEAILERTGQDGRAPTEGPKYQRAVKSYQDLETQIVGLEKSVVLAKEKLEALNPNINTATESLNEVQRKRNQLVQSETNFSQNEQTLTRLEKTMVEAQNTLNQQIDRKQVKVAQYRVKLENDGLFYEVKTGFLRRYLGLQRDRKSVV